MHGGGDVLREIAISPDGKTLAVSYGVVRFFDARTYAQIGSPLRVENESLAYSPDGRTLAIGGENIIHLVDARTRAPLAEAVVDGVAMRIAFTRDASKLVVLVAPGKANNLGGGDAQISVRDAITLKPSGPSIYPDAFVGAYVGFYYSAPQFVLTADDRALLTASEDGELARWDLRSRQKTRTWRIGRTTAPALAVSPDGSIAAIGIEGGLQFVDLGFGTVRTAARGAPGSPNRVQFSPDGKTVASTNLDKTVTLWDVETATPVETLRGHSNSVQQPAFSSDGTTLYTASHDGTAIAWDLTGRRRLGRRFTFTHDRRFSATGYDGHPGVFSPDGRLIAVGLKKQGVAVWDTGNLTPFGAPLVETFGEVKSLAFSPDGRTLAAATNSELTLWDVRTRSRLHSPLLVDDGSDLRVGVGFSPDGATFATSSRTYGVKVWNARTGADLTPLGFGIGASDLAFSSNGKLIAVARPYPGGAALPRCRHAYVDRHVRRLARRLGPIHRAQPRWTFPRGRRVR